jgi:LPS-assembly lipoprotein
MKFARLSVLAGAGLALAACGFHPLYGTSKGVGTGEQEAELATIRVNTIADRQGQKLRNFLIDDLQGEGVPPPPEHELVVTYTEAQADLGLNNDATTTRGQLTIGVTYKLQDIHTGKVESTNTAQQITGYNIQTSEFATILSRDDAEDRALKSIADNMTLRLALYFRNLKENRPTDGMKAPPPPAASTGNFPTHAPGSALDNSSPITQTNP